jgi:hypothetical protein
VDGGKPGQTTSQQQGIRHTSVLKLIESVFNVPPLAARETSNDVGNILDVLDASHYQPEVPALPNPGYVVPSSLCQSGINPSGSSSPVSVPTTVDDEPTVFLQMIASGMLAGFPGHS